MMKNQLQQQEYMNSQGVIQQKRIEDMTNGMTTTFSEAIKEDDQKNMQHDEKVNKPERFLGEEEKYHEWMTKLLAYLRRKYAGNEDVLKWCMKEQKTIDDSVIMVK